VSLSGGAVVGSSGGVTGSAGVNLRNSHCPDVEFKNVPRVHSVGVPGVDVTPPVSSYHMVRQKICAVLALFVPACPLY
jgi:hypothetical protein